MLPRAQDRACAQEWEDECPPPSFLQAAWDLVTLSTLQTCLPQERCLV